MKELVIVIFTALPYEYSGPLDVTAVWVKGRPLKWTTCREEKAEPARYCRRSALYVHLKTVQIYTNVYGTYLHASHGLNLWLYSYSSVPTHRGRLCLDRCVISGDEDVPVLWLEMWASPGRLLASLARPPLVRSWWMAVVLVIPGPVDMTGTVRTSVPMPPELKTCPWHCGFPPDTWTTPQTDSGNYTTCLL